MSTSSENFIEQRESEALTPPAVTNAIASVLSPSEFSKSEIDAKAEIIANSVNEGHFAPLTTLNRLRYMADVCEAAEKKLIDTFLTELRKYGKSAMIEGTKIEEIEAGTKYDYSLTNDSTYFELKAQEAELKEKIKERETFLKTLKPSMEIADAKSGEILNAPIKSSTTTIKLTFKK